jgi:hypothetical protein
MITMLGRSALDRPSSDVFSPVHHGLRAGARVIGLCPEPESATREAIDTAHLRNVPDAGSRISMHHLPPGKRSWFNNRYEGDPWHTFRRWQRAASTLRAAEAATGWKADMVYFPYLD